LLPDFCFAETNLEEASSVCVLYLFPINKPQKQKTKP